MGEKSRKYVMYNGAKVLEHWPAEIEKAQKIPTIVLKGQEFDRVKYGDETEDWGANSHPCGDCAVIKGQFHVENCDVEECPLCHWQLLSCNCYDGE